MISRKSGLFTGLIFVAACSLGATTAVAYLTSPRAQGAISVDEEKKYVYVGTYNSGSRWDHAMDLHAIDANTGVIYGYEEGYEGPYAPRAVATDPNDDSVWIATDSGWMVKNSASLRTASIIEEISSVFHAIDYEQRVCDLALHRDDITVATTIEQTDHGDYGRVVIRYYDAINGRDNEVLFGNLLILDDQIGPSCPRVSFDGDTLYMLFPDISSKGGKDVIFVGTIHRSMGKVTYPGINITTTPALVLPSRDPVKFGYTDIAANAFGFALLEESLYGSANSYVSIYDSAFSLYDTDSRREVRGIDIADWVRGSDYLWWSGWDYTASGANVGTWNVR